MIAHGLSHIANRDGAVMTLISAPTMLGSLLFRLPAGWVDRVLVLPAAPEQLMSALVSLGGKNATRDLRGVAMQALCIVRPGRRRWYELSHPSIDRRIARLAALARRLARPR